MLKKLLSGKKDEFFVQLDDTKTATVAESSSEASSSPAPEPAVVPPVTAPKTSKPAQKTAKKKTATPKPAPVVVAPAPKPQPTQVEFATKYLITDTLVRRQPGPSLNKFKEMARNLKTR
jgi:hypothetical protein